MCNNTLNVHCTILPYAAPIGWQAKPPCEISLEHAACWIAYAGSGELLGGKLVEILQAVVMVW
jgi:hypothetical protein